jgi:glucose/arabinose dehydrogenase
VAVDATQRYWANSPVSADGSIWAANPDGSNPKAIVTGQNNPLQVAVDPSHLYWTNQGDGTIWQANLDGTNPKAFATGQDDPWGVAVSPVVGVG